MVRTQLKGRESQEALDCSRDKGRLVREGNFLCCRVCSILKAFFTYHSRMLCQSWRKEEVTKISFNSYDVWQFFFPRDLDSTLRIRILSFGVNLKLSKISRNSWKIISLAPGMISILSCVNLNTEHYHFLNKSN